MACVNSEDSYQSPYSLITLSFQPEETLDPWLPIERTSKTDQTWQMHRLI